MRVLRIVVGWMVWRPPTVFVHADLDALGEATGATLVAVGLVDRTRVLS